MKSMKYVRAGLMGCVILGVGATSHAVPIVASVDLVTDGTIPPGLHDFDVYDLGSESINISYVPLGISVAITFDPLSGVYSGDTAGETRSPFRKDDDTPSEAHYLNARHADGLDGNSQSWVDVEVTGAMLNSFRLLWGSLDFTTGTYNQIELFNGSESVGKINGQDVATRYGDGLTHGRSNVDVLITSDVAFNRARFTATEEAFEFAFFNPLRADLQSVPEPTMLALSGLALFSVLRRRYHR